MRKISLKENIKRRLKRHRYELVLTWILSGIGCVLVGVGILLYLYVGRLGATKDISSNLNFITFYRLSRILGITFSLSGIMIAGFSLDRILLMRLIYRIIKEKDGKNT